MKRKQIYLDEETDAFLKVVSQGTGRSEAAIIRDAIREYLQRLQREEMSPPGRSHPLSRLIGLARDCLCEEGSTNHDGVLYNLDAAHGPLSEDGESKKGEGRR